MVREQLAAYARMVADDRRFFHLFTDTTTPRPKGEWRVRGRS
jgi:hypothetical protein